MSAPTDPALIARWQSGEISYTEFQHEMKRRNQDIQTAGAAQQLMIHLQGSQNQGYTACNDPEQAAQLVASELALQAESRRRLEERWARELAEKQRKEKEASYVLEQQRSIDRARLSVSLCSSDGQSCLDDLAAKQAQLERDRQAIANSQTDRVRLEYNRRKVEEAPMDWESLPAEEQGYSIAIEMASRREEIAAALGDQLGDTQPAFINTPVVPGVPIPDYSAGYVPGDIPSLADILEDGPPDHPIIDPNLWPEVSEGGDYMQDAVSGGAGGSYPSDVSYGDSVQALPSSYGGDSTKTAQGGELQSSYDPGSFPTGATIKGGEMNSESNWLDDIAGLLRMLDDGFFVEIGPGLSDLSVGQRITGSGTNWMPILLVGGGVVLLIMLLK